MAMQSRFSHFFLFQTSLLSCESEGIRDKKARIVEEWYLIFHLFGIVQVTHRDAPEFEWRKWTWRSQGDLFVNGAFFVQSGDPNGPKRLGTLDHVQAKPGAMVKRLTQFAGVLGGCRPGVAC